MWSTTERRQRVRTRFFQSQIWWFQECLIIGNLSGWCLAIIFWEQNGNFLTYYVFILLSSDIISTFTGVISVVCFSSFVVTSIPLLHAVMINIYHTILSSFVFFFEFLLVCHVCCSVMFVVMITESVLPILVSSHIQHHYHHHPQIKSGWLFRTGDVF